MITIQWDAADAAYLKNVFSQPSGKKFLEMARTAIPRVTAKTMEEVGIEALKKQGAEDLFDYIYSLAFTQPELREGVDYRDLTKEGD